MLTVWAELRIEFGGGSNMSCIHGIPSVAYDMEYYISVTSRKLIFENAW